jgi:hypothetical protein
MAAVPGREYSDVYNWQTGEEVPDWYAQFATYTTGPGPNLVEVVAGKGGGRIINAANRANLLGATLLICANAFTDTPDSIGKLAAYVKANQIPVAAWELANEAYLTCGKPGWKSRSFYRFLALITMLIGIIRRRWRR